MVLLHRRPGAFNVTGLVLAGFLIAGMLVGLAPLAARGQAEDSHDDHQHADEHDHGIVHAEDVAALDLDGRPLTVVASNSILGDVVSRVAGSVAEVELIIPVGQNPHGYQPVPRDIATVETADIVFVNGFGLEEGLLETLETNATGYIVEASETIAGIEGREHDHGEHDHEHDHDHDDHDDHDDHSDHDHDDHDHDDHDDHSDHDHGPIDPHVWFDPLNVVSWVSVIETALSNADPANAEQYRRNAESYRSELETLHEDMRAAFADIPEQRRKLVVDHSAMAYFAERYDFEEIGAIIPDTSDQAEPSSRDLAALVEVIREEQAPAIFVGETAGEGIRGLAAAVTAEVGTPVRVGQLLTGSLTAPDGPGADYLSFMRHNLRQIVENLSD